MRRAVEMRLSGCTLQQIRASTGLSAPTVIGAYKRFLSRGWQGVPPAPRGRQQGAGRALSPALDAALVAAVTASTPELHGLQDLLWHSGAVLRLVQQRSGQALGERATAAWLRRNHLVLQPMAEQARHRQALAQWRMTALPAIVQQARQQGAPLVWMGQISHGPAHQRRRLLVAQTLRGSLVWMPLAAHAAHCITSYVRFLDRLAATWPGQHHILLHGVAADHPALQHWLSRHPAHRLVACPHGPAPPMPASPGPARAAPPMPHPPLTPSRNTPPMRLTHLQRLEAESIHILREVVAECEKPVMLYSIGKDSATMLHLARKAFHPAPPPFPLLHVDTTWKFRDMYAMRARMAAEMGMELLVWHNPEAQAMGINPFDHGSQIHTDMWKTQGLKQALDHHGFDAAFGGARRDEEKSRAKERMFSFRSDQHRWDPKAQRPELWSLYNARKRSGESIRVFPISNWTELDIWQYIQLENIPIVPLYFAAERPVVERNGTLLMVDDARFRLEPDEVPVMRKVRFRTLGCYPLSGAIESEADTLPAIIQEMLLARTSERQGRMIDHDQSASMEKKKQEGYF
jgi:sulfate adenylyltransferase subunit 2